MLNISNNPIGEHINKEDYKAFSLLKNSSTLWIVSLSIGVLLLFMLCVSFLPWTQNIQAKGYVTSLKPEQRPQDLQSIIDGRVEKWFVNEGDLVKQGDTILLLSEIKDDYFDPQLLERTQDQIDVKKQAIDSYKQKVNSLNNQVNALKESQELKIEQAKNYFKQTQFKVQSDSMNWVASLTDMTIAEQQLERTKNLHAKGLKSLTDLEAKRNKQQETSAKAIAAENKFLSSKNALINARVELSAVENEYTNKINKAASDKFTAQSTIYDTEATVSKMETQYANYSARTGFYVIKAPQDGYITQAIVTGIGETIKAGGKLLTLMPANYERAVELYVNPVDLPLIKKGQEFRFVFDGWPSIVFAGWPNASFGTFGGRVMAIDNITNKNGKYRILIEQDNEMQIWPEQLRLGAGANGFALLNDVPVWYEVWRKLNAFPPNYYEEEEGKELDKKKKAPLKKVK